MNIILGMSTRKRLSVARIVSLLDAGHWIAIPLRQDATGNWLENLPLFVAPNRNPESIAVILSNAFGISSLYTDIPQDVVAEEIISGIIISFSLIWFTNGSMRLLPQKPVITTGPDGEYPSWEIIQGQFFLDPPFTLLQIAERVVRISG